MSGVDLYDPASKTNSCVFVIFKSSKFGRKR